MTNKLTLDFDLFQFVAGNRRIVREYGRKVLDVTGDRWVHNIQSIGTSEEAIDMGDIAAGGFSFWWNHDATNFVTIRSGTGADDLVKIGPGEPALFRLTASAPYAIADTAACELEYVILEA